MADPFNLWTPAPRAKDDAVRLTDTIAFIRTATVPGPNMNQRDPVANILHARHTAGRIPDTFRQAMSQGHNFTVFGRDGAAVGAGITAWQIVG